MTGVGIRAVRGQAICSSNRCATWSASTTTPTTWASASAGT